MKAVWIACEEEENREREKRERERGERSSCWSSFQPVTSTGAV
jgi:hypothetical protein